MDKKALLIDTAPIGEWWMWLGFFAFVLVMIAIDIFFLNHSKKQTVSIRVALGWSVTWVSLALMFNALLWFYVAETHGALVAHHKALEFFTGYLIEKFLSFDNLFVFYVIFNYFAIPPEYQRRVLLYGVLGAIVLRLVMILSGIWLVAQFHWVLYLFGGFLVLSGAKMLYLVNDEPDLSKNFILIYLQKHLKVTKELHKEHFFIKKDHVLYCTPLFVTLIFVEISDLVFAIDSIPAIFAITKDPFIVVTSNIFAILGLRALYFLLIGISEKFHLLKYGLAVILMFIGSKMLIVPWYKMPIEMVLSVVVSVLVASILLSLWSKPKSYLP